MNTSRRVRERALALAAKPAEQDATPALEHGYAERCLEHMPARALLVLDAATVAGTCAWPGASP